MPCPMGTVALGGGAGAVSAYGLAGAYPETGGAGWVGVINNPGIDSLNFNIWALCAKKPAGYKIVRAAGVVVAAGSTRGNAAFCPTGTEVLGGGASIDSTSATVALNSSYPSNQTTWGISVANASASGVTEHAWAVCGKNIKGWTLVTGTPDNVGAGSSGGAIVRVPGNQRGARWRGCFEQRERRGDALLFGPRWLARVGRRRTQREPGCRADHAVRDLRGDVRPDGASSPGAARPGVMVMS